MKTKAKRKPVKKSVTIKKRLKRASNPDFNLDHPDLRDVIEYAFTAGGVDYFQFKAEVEIPAGRYTWIDAYMREHEMRMSLDVIRGYISALREQLSGELGHVNAGAANIILYKMETRTNLAFSPETIKRLASVIYFDASENLKGYDQEYGNKKIALWEKHKSLDFFLCRPMKELLGLHDISPESLQTYIAQSQEILRELTSTPSTPPAGNT
jgi:hypothetical protein